MPVVALRTCHRPGARACNRRRLRAAIPGVRILVGRWAPPSLADDNTQLLHEAGADLVASTFSETRTYLTALTENTEESQVISPAA